MWRAAACVWMVWSMLSSATQGAPTCQLRFDVLPNATKLTFEGYSTYSIIDGQFPIVMMDPSARVGLEGPMYATLPGACPAVKDERGWLAAARQLLLTSAPNPYVYQPLEVFPSVLEAGVFGLPLNFSNLEVNLTLAAKGQAGAAQGQANQLPMAISAVVTSGWAFSNTSFTGGERNCG